MSKKTETIEIRVSPELKGELHNLSRARGESMSLIVRNLVQSEVSGFAKCNDNGVNTMRIFKKLSGFGAAVAGVAALAIGWNLTTQSVAFAQDSVQLAFEAMDHDGDGVITKQEYNTPPENFSDDGTPPGDSSGQTNAVPALPAVCEAEMAAFASAPAPYAGPDFADMDKNADDVIDLSELKGAILAETKRVFGMYDTDASGDLILAEFATDIFGNDPHLSDECNAALRAQIPADPYFEHNTRVLFDGMDADHNGHLSLAEFIQAF